MNIENDQDNNLVISEYGEPRIVEIAGDEDWDYLLKKCFKGKINVSIGRKIKYKNNFVEVSIKDYTGVVQLKVKRLHFATKVHAHVFYMLSFLRLERDQKEKFLFDPNKPIEMEEGINFFDPLGKLFLNQLEYIIKKGLSKKFVKMHRNETYLKGNNSISGQIQNDINNIPKFSCDFSILTVNNNLNQIILRSLIYLVPKIKFNKNLKKALKRYEYSLRHYIELKEISPDTCDNISFNESNYYYYDIIQLCKMILKERYIRSTYEGKSTGFNFLVETNMMLQDFLAEMIKSVVENDFNDEFDALSQLRIRSIIKRRWDKPDAVIRRIGRRSPHIIFEIKNKKRDTTPDYVQATRYGLAARDVESCCLLYPKSEYEIEDETSFPKYNTEENSEEIPLYVRAIDLYMDKNLSFEEFIEGVKAQVKNIIMEINLKKF